MNRKVLYQIGIGLGAVFSFANMLFNKDHIQWLEYSGPVIIYISFFLIRVIRIPQIILEFIIIITVILSSFYLTKYTIEIVFICFFYFITISILHILKICPLTRED